MDDNLGAEIEPDVLAESEQFAVWRNREMDEEFIYHIELGGITLHLSGDEWEELVVLIREASA